MTKTETELRESEAERVLANVEEHFGKLGFNSFQAMALAEAHADWHEAARLIQGGCSLETALDLLL